MKKYILLLGVVAVLSFVFLSLGKFLNAQEATPPETVTAECSFGKVTFSHKLHAEAAACKDCHHMAESPVQKCKSCHTADAKLNSKDAYHKNCIDCHKEKAKGPTGCMDCHKKE